MANIVAVYSNGKEISYNGNIIGGEFRYMGKRPYKFIIPKGLHPSEVHYLYGYVDYFNDDVERLEVIKEN